MSVGQPRWTADGGLVFVDDRTGWWLPYRLAPDALDRLAAGAAGRDAGAAPLVDREAEFHGPDWIFGLHTFDELADGALVARMGTGGRDRLVVLRPPTGGPGAGSWSVAEVDQPCVSLAGVVSPDGESVVVHGTTPTEAHAVFAVTVDGSAPPRRLSAPPGWWSPPDRPPTRCPCGPPSATTPVPGLFFPPINPDVVVRPGGAAPAGGVLPRRARPRRPSPATTRRSSS